MRLTKHAHATIALIDGSHSLLLDPGTFTANAGELIAATDAVLITHDHPDHFDPATLKAALVTRPELRVWAPESVVAALGSHGGQVTPVEPGDQFDAGGFTVDVVGGAHAVIHPDIPLMSNVGYLISSDTTGADVVYHPGDSYVVPEARIATLLAPSSGPWTKMEHLVDFIRAVAPQRTIQIHDMMLSDFGRGSSARFTQQLTGTELLTLADGESLDV